MSEKYKIKISRDATFEEMQGAIRQILGKLDFVLSEDEFKFFKGIDQQEYADWEKSRKLLGPIYDEYLGRQDPEGLKRKKEINDILHYMRFSKDNWRFISIGESPDFIVCM